MQITSAPMWFANPISQFSSVQLFSATLSNLRSLAAEDWREICKPYQLFSQSSADDDDKPYASVSSVQFSCSALPFQTLGAWPRRTGGRFANPIRQNRSPWQGVGLGRWTTQPGQVSRKNSLGCIQARVFSSKNSFNRKNSLGCIQARVFSTKCTQPNSSSRTSVWLRYFN